MYSLYQKTWEKKQVDIFSANFFEMNTSDDEEKKDNDRDPMAEKDVMASSIELLPIGEELSHSVTYLTETMTACNNEASPAVYYVPKMGSSTVENDSTGEPKYLTDRKQDISDSPKVKHMQKIDDNSGTNTTSKSTAYESSDIGNEAGNSELERIHDQNLAPLQRDFLYDGNDERRKAQRSLFGLECTAHVCLITKHKIDIQEEEIKRLQEKLKRYKDIFHHNNFIYNMLAATADECIFSDNRTTTTNYKEKTYADLMGPWDIPFHIDVHSDDGSDEESEITFAQHPCKMSESFQSRRHCPVDDDGALPLVQPQEKTGLFTGRTALQRRYHDQQPPSCQKQVPSQFPNTEKNGKQTIGEREPRAQRMCVIITRKYCRQKAWYSGQIHPEKGCPHGIGTLLFSNSDRYIGEMSYGEMTGKGTYYFRKKQQVFRGDFFRNTFVGNQQLREKEKKQRPAN